MFFSILDYFSLNVDFTWFHYQYEKISELVQNDTVGKLRKEIDVIPEFVKLSKGRNQLEGKLPIFT